MMKKWFFLTLPLLLGAVSCAPSSSTPSTSAEEYPALEYSVSYRETAEGKGVITDAIGREVEIKPGSYRRVVCIGAGALRLYSYVGDMSLVCGVEDIDNTSLQDRPKMFDGVARPYLLANEEALQKLPSCGVGGPNAQTAEPEKILSCNPDIVISEYEDKEKEDALQERLNVPVLTLNYGNGGLVDNGIYSTLAMLGKAFGKEARAKELIDYHYGAMKTIFDKTKDISSKKKAYICGLGNWGTTNQFMTAQNYNIFNIAHIDNVVSGLAKDGIQKIDEEKFITLAPEMDIMIFDAAAVKNIKGKEYDFSICKAFKSGEVYLQMAYNAYYTNVETALINAWFTAKSVYPDRFNDISIDAKADEITEKFNGTKLYDVMKAKPQSFGGYQKIANPSEFFK